MIPYSSPDGVTARIGRSTLGAGFCVVDEAFAKQLLSTHERWFELTRGEADRFTFVVANVSDEALAHLDDNGVAKIGTSMKPGMILVGRTTARGGEVLSPQEKLLRAIFGEATSDVVDSSLRVPPCVFGDVATIEVSSGERRVRLTWERPLEVGDVLNVGGSHVVVTGITPLDGVDVAWSGGGATARVTKHALVRDVLHGRSVGPYDVLTQQPLRAQESFGGQVASEALLTSLLPHAPWLVFELLTLRADAVTERPRVYEALATHRNPGADFFEAPKYRDNTRTEIVHLLRALLRALCLEVDLTEREVRVLRLTDETVRERSFGEVRSAADLASQQIFGPVNDYECQCGKYKRMRDRNVICEACGVEVTLSKVRRERFGFITLDAPLRHPLDASWELTVLPVLPPDLRPAAFTAFDELYVRVLEEKSQAAVDALFTALHETVDDRWRTRVFSKAVDYSAVTHLTVDPSLSPGHCRLPRVLANELFKPWAFAVLERKGYVATIKSAKRMVEQGVFEGLRCIEAACIGWPLIISSATQVVSRKIEVWDAPALAVDEETAKLLASHEVKLFVPVTSQAAVEAAGLSCAVVADQSSSAGWLSRARVDGALVDAALNSTSADSLDDDLLRLALGWWPQVNDGAELEHWEQSRREFERNYPTADPAKADQPDPRFLRSVQNLGVSDAMANVFQRMGIATIGDLVQQTDSQFLKMDGFKREDLRELKKLLNELGFSLGMKL